MPTYPPLALLLGRPHQDLADGDVARPGDDVRDGVGDVLCLHRLGPGGLGERNPSITSARLCVINSVAVAPGSIERNPYVTPRHFLT